ncbi:MAG: PEP/pyruvate-binding domain-containing protein [Candidatus Kerfeldbacteria bacterium]|nr:PEP/pyruvate-binding domain-containing protein [Candidatus Kerfeldbacteria bacterium]
MKSSKAFVSPFSKLDKKSVNLAGGKGANLGEMTAHHIPVPQGFVVLRTAFDQFMRDTGIDSLASRMLRTVDPKVLASINRASRELRRKIQNASFPPELAREVFAAFTKLHNTTVAVRSSATAEDSSTASWAGELESYLFIRKPQLLKTIQTCWSSLFTPRAIFYRFEKKLHTIPVSVAVVVQEMIDSEVAGITFTAHPVTKNRQHMVIEAGWGQGEAVVSGRITPDTYVVDRKSDAILDIAVSRQERMIQRKGTQGTREVMVPLAKREKQKLKSAQIMKIARLCATIEKHYGTPQDIEWAWSHNKFYITQTRPITTL